MKRIYTAVEARAVEAAGIDMMICTSVNAAEVRAANKTTFCTAALASTNKIHVCSIDDIDEQDVMRFDHGDQSLAVYHAPDGAFYATDGWCTHEKAHLGEGIVDAFEIECPLHFGAFDYRTGDPTVPPVCIALKMYKVHVEDGQKYLEA